MKRYRRFRLILLLLLMPLLLCSCSVGMEIDELFSLPQLPDDYLNLRSALNEMLSSGAVYSAPEGGTHRQSVQLMDLNGSGKEEAIACFSVSGEKPLKIVIFTMEEDRYSRAAVIEGDGNDIEQLDYADMDGDGWTEIIVGWGMDSGLKMISIYSLRSFQVSCVATTDYTRSILADLNGDGNRDLAVIRFDDTEGGYSATVISMDTDGETVTSSARLSAGLEGISKLSAGTLKDAASALFAEGSLNGGLVTDILVYRDETLSNLTLDAESGVSTSTVRNSTVSFRDLMETGKPLIPIPRALPAQGDTVYRVLDWYAFDSRGRCSIACTTYHNNSDSWYLTLPDEWGSTISIRREDSDTGERAVVFSVWNGENRDVLDFLIVYAISGENRESLAGKEGRFILYSGTETVYAAELLISRSDWSLIPDISYLRSHFHLIYSEWITQ